MKMPRWKNRWKGRWKDRRKDEWTDPSHYHQGLKKYIQISEVIRLFVIEYWIVCNILFANISWHMLIYFLEGGQQIYLDPISLILS